MPRLAVGKGREGKQILSGVIPSGGGDSGGIFTLHAPPVVVAVPPSWELGGGMHAGAAHRLSFNMFSFCSLLLPVVLGSKRHFGCCNTHPGQCPGDYSAQDDSHLGGNLPDARRGGEDTFFLNDKIWHVAALAAVKPPPHHPQPCYMWRAA